MQGFVLLVYTVQMGHYQLNNIMLMQVQATPKLLVSKCMHCSAGPPHGVNTLWLLSEGISITAGRCAKVNGNNHIKGWPGWYLVCVILL